MQFSYFTERPYRGVDEDEVLKNRAFFALPNEQFDRELAANDFNYYLDENCYAEELGFDAVALNEHHGNPFCMDTMAVSRPRSGAIPRAARGRVCAFIARIT